MKVLVSREEYERIELRHMALVEFDYFKGILKPLQTLYVCEPFRISKGGKVYYCYDYPPDHIPKGFFKPAHIMPIKLCRLQLFVHEVFGETAAFVAVSWNRYSYREKSVDLEMIRVIN